MNGIESLALSTLGGSNVVAVNDLTGTSLRHASIDLAATDEGGDGSPDIVIANGSSRRRQGPRRNHGEQRRRDRAPGRLQVAGSEATNDGLQIDTLGGKDSVSVASTVSQFINPSVDLGADQ